MARPSLHWPLSLSCCRRRAPWAVPDCRRPGDKSRARALGQQPIPRLPPVSHLQVGRSCPWPWARCWRSRQRMLVATRARLQRRRPARPCEPWQSSVSSWTHRSKQPKMRLRLPERRRRRERPRRERLWRERLLRERRKLLRHLPSSRQLLRQVLSIPLLLVCSVQRQCKHRPMQQPWAWAWHLSTAWQQWEAWHQWEAWVWAWAWHRWAVRHPWAWAWAWLPWVAWLPWARQALEHLLHLLLMMAIPWQQ
mmetsp:Transcript_120466/g.225179  ORF Transcript_120466/g.225179 Transcript_120466/m.225179 type:complete len:251 (-) Transcript_120466:181-933(-)